MAARCALQGRKKNRYQDPSKRKKRRVLTEEEKEAARQAAALRKAERERAAAELAAQRSFRRSTKAKTDAASKARAAEERQRKVSASDSSRRDDRWALNVCFCCSNQAAARKRPAPVKSVALTAQEVGNALFGLQCLGDSEEARQLVSSLTPKMEGCPGCRFILQNVCIFILNL